MSLLSQKNRIIILSLFVLVFIIAFVQSSQAANVDSLDYPRLANYFLPWTISDSEARELSKWDLLVLDMEVQANSRRQMEMIRDYNPDIIILAYISSMETRFDMAGNGHATMKNRLMSGIDDGWWLRDSNGSKLTFWSNNWMINITDQARYVNGRGRWNDYLPQFVNNEILSTGLWDGVYFDNTWHEIGWYQDGKIDLDLDSRGEDVNTLNNEWRSGMIKILNNTRKLVGSRYLVMGNGSSYDGFQPYLNGIMLETFPTPWEGDGSWTSSMNAYARVAEMNRTPNTTIINTNDKNQYDYQKMRFGLTSVLLGDGFSSFDYGEVDHSQTWWYDEYSFSMGKPQSAPERVDAPGSGFAPGVWKREYDKGVVYVNSGWTAKTISLDYEAKKLLGEQNRILNNGGVVDKITLAPMDGLIMETLETKSNTQSGTCRNYKVYDGQGHLMNDSYSVCDKAFEYLYVKYSGDKRIVESAVNSLSIIDSNGDSLKERVDPVKYGGEPHVRIFSQNDNRLLGVFAAYPSFFRCGLRVKAGDVDGDGVPEIVTIPDWGGAHARVFGFNGKMKNEFFFETLTWRGSYDVRLKDVNGDGVKEILLLSY